MRLRFLTSIVCYYAIRVVPAVVCQLVGIQTVLIPNDCLIIQTLCVTLMVTVGLVEVILPTLTLCVTLVVVVLLRMGALPRVVAVPLVDNNRVWRDMIG